LDFLEILFTNTISLKKDNKVQTFTVSQAYKQMQSINVAYRCSLIRFQKAV